MKDITDNLKDIEFLNCSECRGLLTELYNKNGTRMRVCSRKWCSLGVKIDKIKNWKLDSSGSFDTIS